MLKTKILLTGATGFLGSHLLDALVTAGFCVTVVKRSSSCLWRIEHLEGKYESFDANSQPLEKIFERAPIDCVIHMATHYKKFEVASDALEMVEANVDFPSEILALAASHNVKGFMNTGTFYGLDCSRQPVNEAAQPKPFNYYAETKLAFEDILKTYSGLLSVNTFNLFSPFGERDNDKLIPYIIRNALKKSPIKLSEGLQKIDLIYSGDIVYAYLQALTRWQDNGFKPEYEVFNLGSGEALSIRDIVSLIEVSLGCRIKAEWGDKSHSDIPIAYADISKAKRMLQWHPYHGVKSGLSNTISYYKDHS